MVMAWDCEFFFPLISQAYCRRFISCFSSFLQLTISFARSLSVWGGRKSFHLKTWKFFSAITSSENICIGATVRPTTIVLSRDDSNTAASLMQISLKWNRSNQPIQSHQLQMTNKSQNSLWTLSFGVWMSFWMLSTSLNDIFYGHVFHFLTANKNLSIFLSLRWLVLVPFSPQ